jgi:hypothetical protein
MLQAKLQYWPISECRRPNPLPLPFDLEKCRYIFEELDSDQESNTAAKAARTMVSNIFFPCPAGENMK